MSDLNKKKIADLSEKKNSENQLSIESELPVGHIVKVITPNEALKISEDYKSKAELEYQRVYKFLKPIVFDLLIKDRNCIYLSTIQRELEKKNETIRYIDLVKYVKCILKEINETSYKYYIIGTDIRGRGCIYGHSNLFPKYIPKDFEEEYINKIYEDYRNYILNLIAENGIPVNITNIIINEINPENIFYYGKTNMKKLRLKCIKRILNEMNDKTSNIKYDIENEYYEDTYMIVVKNKPACSIM